jgi:hypothetical protein
VEVPLDNEQILLLLGLSVLIGAGIWLGVKYFFGKRNSKKLSRTSE